MGYENFISESQKLNPSPVIELFTFDFTQMPTYTSGSPTIYQVTGEKENVTFEGDTYVAGGIEFRPAPIDLEGKIPNPELVAFGQDSIFRQALNNFGTILLLPIIRTKVRRVHLDDGANPDPLAKVEEIWYVDELLVRTKDELKWNLTPAPGLGKPSVSALGTQTRRSFNA